MTALFRWSLGAALALALATSCSDQPTGLDPALPSHDERQIGTLTQSVRTSNAEVSGYWRRPLEGGADDAELWLYRNEPELGFNAHIPRDVMWITPDSTGSTLIRHAIYWQMPIQDAINQLSAAMSLAPDGATLLVVVHSKDICVDYSTPGDRLAKYQAFAAYIRTLAASAPRSGSKRVLYWQIYNEANYPGWTNMFGAPSTEGADTLCAGDGSSEYTQGQRYAELLKYAYPAVKEATNDSAWVVMSALASVDSSTDVYSTTGRYAFLHGMYSNGAKEYYDIAAIQPYGHPGIFGIRRTSDFDRALAVYGDETRPMFMTEFGSKEPIATQWADLRDQIHSARATRLYNKIFIFTMCASGDPYSMRLDHTGWCDAPTPSYTNIQSARYNSALYGADSVVPTDVVVRRSRNGIEPIGYAFTDEAGGSQFRIHDVPVHYREPTRIRFRSAHGSSAGSARVGVQYRVFVDRFGWTEWTTDSADASAFNFGRPLNAVQVRLVHANEQSGQIVYSVFRARAWSPWVADGAIAGDTTVIASGFRARIIPPAGVAPENGSGVCYALHTTAGAWHAPVCDGGSAPEVPSFDGLRVWLKEP